MKNFDAPGHKLLSRLGLFALPLILAAGTAATQAAPHVPVTDTEVLERLPGRPTDASARELKGLRTALAQAPRDAQAAQALAQHYFDLAMARGDPRFIGYAQAVITPFVSAMTADLLLVRGQLRQYRHEFELALEDFAAALRLNPDLAQAHAWRGAIYLVQGNYDTTRETCQALTTLGREALAGACKGLLQAYGGQLQAADQTLQQALKLSSQPESQLWLLTRLAEVAAWRGQAKQAEQHYKVALALQLDDGYLLAAWSDFLLDANRPAEVVKLLASWEASDGLLLRLAEAEALLKLPQASRHAQALEDRFSAAKLRGDVTHRAEEARFQLRLRGQAAAALALAQANYQVQREPRDARILLEAAVAARQPAAAQPALDWLSRSGFEDPRLRSLAQTLLGAKP
jgi:tetratricopeptide (TPR) repeat protein